MLDTAGRLHVDAALMAEMQSVAERLGAAGNPSRRRRADRPGRGQRRPEFSTQVDLSGVVLTRMDGDARGGAALSMRHVTGKPIKFVGVGEKLDALDAFDPKRVAGRILGMGDVVSLVEKAAEIDRAGGCRGARGEDGEGSVRHERPSLAARADEAHGRHGRDVSMLPGMGKLAAQARRPAPTTSCSAAWRRSSCR